MKGKIIVIEGACDGIGKTTQFNLLKNELEKLIETEKHEPWYGQLMTTPQTIAYFLQINYWLKKYKINIK